MYDLLQEHAEVCEQERMSVFGNTCSLAQGR
jgi:hypothetical protein